MNPYAIAGACALVVASFFYGQHIGKTTEALDNAEKQALIDATAAKAREAAAEEIAKIKIVNKTITQKVQKEIVEKEIYMECRHSKEQTEYINEALLGGL